MKHGGYADNLLCGKAGFDVPLVIAGHCETIALYADNAVQCIAAVFTGKKHDISAADALWRNENHAVAHMMKKGRHAGPGYADIGLSILGKILSDAEKYSSVGRT